MGSNNTSRTISYRTKWAILALAATAVAALIGSAAAYPVGGTHSATSIAKSCSAAGGVFTTSDAGDYRCESALGSISCTSAGRCEGHCATCPDVVGSKNNNVDSILGGTKLKVGITATTKTTVKPPLVNQPVSSVSDAASRTEDSHHNKK
jgi:hypothetical protein